MANVTGNNAAIGDLAKTGGAEIISVTADATGFAKGELVSFDANGLAELSGAGDEIGDGFGIALETASASEANIRIAVGNTYVYCKAGEAIKPFALVKADATGGRIGSHKTVADVTTNTTAAINGIKDYFGLAVGRYIGHQLEEALTTDAADGDIIAVRLGL